MRFFAPIVTFLLLAGANGQVRPPSKPTPAKPKPQVEAPVSAAEASAVFAKATRVMRKVLRIEGDVPSFPASAGIASRDGIVRQFGSIYDLVAPKFKFSLPKVKARPDLMSLGDSHARSIAERLEALGFIDRFGPLVTAKSGGIQPAEFGDAIGYFMARVAELTHTPTAKFSPYLMNPGG